MFSYRIKAVWKSILVISRCLGNILDFFFFFWCKNVCVLYSREKAIHELKWTCYSETQKVVYFLVFCVVWLRTVRKPLTTTATKTNWNWRYVQPSCCVIWIFFFVLCKSSVQFSVLFCFSVCLSLSVCIGVCVVLMMREEVVSLTNTYASRANK